MRRLIILALGLLMVSCQSNSGDASLTATIPNIEEGTPVYISKLKNGQIPVPIDTVKVENGKISVNLPEVDFQTLNFLTIEGVKGNMLFINENAALTATVYKDSLRRSDIQGGEANQLFMAYSDFLMNNNRKMKKLIEDLRAQGLRGIKLKQALDKKRSEITRENTEFRKHFIEENPNTLPTIFVFADLKRSQQATYPEMKQLYDGLSKNLKETHFGQQIGQSLAQSAATSIGSKAPQFSAKTPEGETLALKEVVSSGKYTLIDFWASWCKPCRMENPNLVKTYKQYHDEGFNILGVSLDKKHKDWVKAIKKDGLIWPQISHLKFWQDPIAKKYNVRAIPANFLVDQDGNIVAKNLRGAALGEKMKELFGQ